MNGDDEVSEAPQFADLLETLEVPEEFTEKIAALEAQGTPLYETAPYDARFPNQNQTKNCWQNYADYHKCLRAKGPEYEPCKYFYKIYRDICPELWVRPPFHATLPKESP